MITIIFTSDHEIYGNGDGSPKKLIIDPTYRMMELFSKYKAKLTIMADTAEIIKFKEYRDITSEDLFYYDQIEAQLKCAIRSGHDVQLHLHPSYFNARYSNGSWLQDYTEYDLANLSFERMDEIICNSKTYLEDLLKPINPNYQCSSFRAANWSMQPSKNIVRALIKNNFKIDTSVFKYGCRNDFVKFNYTRAFSDLLPWPVSEDDICVYDENSRLFEVPIYCENRHIYSFISCNRLIGMRNEINHKLGEKGVENTTARTMDKKQKIFLNKAFINSKMLFSTHAWKMDFNKCTAGQLIDGVKRVKKKYGSLDWNIPLVLIGHSKLFNNINEKQIKRFLEYIACNSSDYSFGKFDDIDLNIFLKNQNNKV